MIRNDLKGLEGIGRDAGSGAPRTVLYGRMWCGGLEEACVTYKRRKKIHVQRRVHDFSIVLVVLL